MTDDPAEVIAAAKVLGVAVTEDGAVVRDAYRRAIRRCHPDVVGPAGVEQSRRVNEAYRVLRTRRRTIAPAVPAPRPDSGAGRGAPRDDVEAADEALARLDGTDTLVLDEPADVAFGLVLWAAHEIGDVTYVDADCAIVETVLSDVVDGCRRVRSVVVTFQGRSDGTTEAFVTLERIDGPPPAAGDLDRVARSLIAAIRTRRGR